MAVKRLSVPLPRKDGRVFVKRPDPHEEALTILRGQVGPPVAAPGTQVRGLGLVGPRRNRRQRGGLWGSLCVLWWAVFVGTGPQRGRGLGEASDQHTAAIRGAAPGEGQEGGRAGGQVSECRLVGVSTGGVCVHVPGPVWTYYVDVCAIVSLFAWH